MLHLRVIERCAEIGQAELTLPSPALPSDARLDYALSQMDAWAGGYLPLVSTLADHDDYALLLKSYVRKAWIIYRGISGIEPFGPNRPLGLIQERSMYWYKEGLRRLAPKPTGQPSEKITLRRGYRAEVRAWMRNEGIRSVKKAAKELAVSDSTLKSIMSNRGDVRYSPETLTEILEKIGYLNSE